MNIQDTIRQMGNCPLAFCIIRLILDKQERPIDWRFEYANDALEELEGVSKETLLSKSFYEIFPDGDRKWLRHYYECAYNGAVLSIEDISIEVDKWLHIHCFPVEDKGCCACLIENVTETRYSDIDSTYAHVHKIAADVDSMTETWNRNSFEMKVHSLCLNIPENLVCIYFDVNGLHATNNSLGHSYGDRILKTVAHTLSKLWPEEVYRIGGDEFVVLTNDQFAAALQKMNRAKKILAAEHFYISVGVASLKEQQRVGDMLVEAERNMFADKKEYYEHFDRIGNARLINATIEKVMQEKDDLERFSRAVSEKYKGVYVVNHLLDTCRSIIIPDYFKEMLSTHNGYFTKALDCYINTQVAPDYQTTIRELLQYTKVKNSLAQNNSIRMTYPKTNGDWVLLTISNIPDGNANETFWIFSNV